MPSLTQPDAFSAWFAPSPGVEYTVRLRVSDGCRSDETTVQVKVPVSLKDASQAIAQDVYNRTCAGTQTQHVVSAGRAYWWFVSLL